MGTNPVSSFRCTAATTLLALGCSQDATLVDAIAANDAAAGSGGQDAGSDASGSGGTGGVDASGDGGGAAGSSGTGGTGGAGGGCPSVAPVRVIIQ